MTTFNLILSAMNAYFAWDSFSKGQTGSGWISLTVSAFCFVAAVV
jgi:hypothetical protein